MLPLRVLLTHYGDEWIRGSERVLIDLLKCFDKAKIEPVVWCNSDALASVLKAEGYLVHQTAFEFFFDYDSNYFRPSKYWALVREGRSLVARYGINILHANSAAPTQWLLPVARSARIPLLTHLHISYLPRSRYALLLHQADSLVGVCEEVVHGLRADKVKESKIRVIHNGIDFNRMEVPNKSLRCTLGIPEDAQVIGVASSLISRKGNDILINALALIKRTIAPHVIIAGSGPEKSNLEALARERGVAERVHLIGYCDPISNLYDAANIIALATRADALPLALIEAAFCGKPIVATRVGGIAEAVVDGQTGLLVPPNNVTALAAAICRLLDEPQTRSTMGQAGANRARAVFSVQRMTSEFEIEYARLAAQTPLTLGWAAAFGKLPPYLRVLTRLVSSSARF